MASKSNGDAPTGSSETFLPGLTKSFTELQNGQQDIETGGFCEAMARILPVFDELGDMNICAACLVDNNPYNPPVRYGVTGVRRNAK